jgi:hypothetical protein
MVGNFLEISDILRFEHLSTCADRANAMKQSKVEENASGRNFLEISLKFRR